MPKTETNQPRQKPDRVVLALVTLTCGLVAAAVFVRRTSRPTPAGVKLPPPPPAAVAGQKPRTAQSQIEAPKGETQKVEQPATGIVTQTYAVYSNVSPMMMDFVDRKSKTRVTADITARIERVQTEADLAAVVAILKDTTDSDTVRHEAASLLARSGYPKLIDDLIAILMNPAERPRFRGFCVQHLWMNHEAADAKQKLRVETVLQERLGDPDVSVQREALLALARLGHPEGKRMAEQWLTDPAAEDNRDMAIRCMATLNNRERIPEIRGCLRTTNAIVRLAAITVLSDWGDTESRGAFEEAAVSGQERLQHAGKLALKKLDLR
jgi:HEAT repeat protein